MQRNTIKALISDLRHLRENDCHNEARMKLALAFNRFDEARILTCLDIIQGCEKHMPRALEMYRASITERLLRYVREREGHHVAETILRALTVTNK